MPKPKSKEKPGKKSGLHRKQTGRSALVHRSQVNPAPYNPRLMDEAQRAELDASLHRHGLVIPLVWNKKTGNLVGGHQRLEWLDLKHPGLDYELTVSVVNLEIPAEKRLNILLNNQAAQGSFHIESLCSIIKETGFEGTAFNAETIRTLVPVEMADNIFGTPEIPEPLRVKTIEAQKRHIILVFQNRQGADDFSRLLGFDPEDYCMDGYRLRTVIEDLYPM